MDSAHHTTATHASANLCVHPPTPGRCLHRRHPAGVWFGLVLGGCKIMGCYLKIWQEKNWEDRQHIDWAWHGKPAIKPSAGSVILKLQMSSWIGALSTKLSSIRCWMIFLQVSDFSTLKQLHRYHPIWKNTVISRRHTACTGQTWAFLIPRPHEKI